MAHQKPYMEQQLPLGQSPHTVPPFEEPHVPSTVASAVWVVSGAAVDETGTILGSCDDDVAVVLEVPSVQPSWQPFETRQ